jgi:hypothetical protein
LNCRFLFIRHQTYPTSKAVSNGTYTNSSLNSSSPWFYWLRSLYSGDAGDVRLVDSAGSLNNNNAYGGLLGVRAALNLKSKIYVIQEAPGEYSVIN